MSKRSENLTGQLALTLAFFSRFTLSQSLATQIKPDARLGEAAGFFPLAGLIIAIIPAFIWFIASLLLPPILAAGLAILSGILITGGLHEDGFADCADGLGASQKPERVLEIMRDSRIGTYGGLALIITVGLRWLALATLTPLAGVAAIFIAYCASRSAMTLAMQFSYYARSEGLGSQADGMEREGFFIAIGIAFIVAIALGGFAGITAIILGFAFAFLFLRYLEFRIGGYTGDGLGAMQQICEITTLITLAGFWT